MKKLSWLIIVGCWMLAACTGADTDASVAEDTPNTVTLVTHIQQCSRLYTAEYKVHKIVTHDDVLKLQGQLTGQDYDINLPFLGDRKIAIPMDATLKAYIDFEGFSEENVEHDGQKIIITLPDPQVMLTSSKIDHANIKKYVALLRSDFTDAELTSYERQGRQAIINAVPDMDIIETARQNAARILIPMMEQMGYQEQDITITFRKDMVVRVKE